MADITNLFSKELSRIKDRSIREIAENFLSFAPDYFPEIPSSSTGKYHPPDENCKGGRILHNKRVFRLTEYLCEAFGIIGVKKDLMLVAALIHDLYCRGTNNTPLPYTDPYHTSTIAKAVQNYADQYDTETYYINFLALLVAGHAGPFSTNPDIIENNKYARLLYIADYIASRKDVEVKVEK